MTDIVQKYSQFGRRQSAESCCTAGNILQHYFRQGKSPHTFSPLGDESRTLPDPASFTDPSLANTVICSSKSSPSSSECRTVMTAAAPLPNAGCCMPRFSSKRKILTIFDFVTGFESEVAAIRLKSTLSTDETEPEADTSNTWEDSDQGANISDILSSIFVEYD